VTVTNIASFPRTIQDWHNLPNDLIESNSPPLFKCKLQLSIFIHMQAANNNLTPDYFTADINLYIKCTIIVAA